MSSAEREAVINFKAVDSFSQVLRQMTTELNNFKTGLTGAKTTVTQTINGMATDFKTLNAGMTQTGIAMQTTGEQAANMGVQFQNTVKQSQSLGDQTTSLSQKLGGIGKDFTGLTANLGTFTFSVINLQRQYRDLGNEQLAVERKARKLSLAQESLGKAQDKLNKLEEKGITSGKAHEQALLDVNQAQANVEIGTEALRQTQQKYQDTQQNFSLGVIPTIISGVGSLVEGLSKMKNITGEVKAAIAALKGVAAGAGLTIGQFGLVVAGIVTGVGIAINGVSALIQWADAFNRAVKGDILGGLKALLTALDAITVVDPAKNPLSIFNILNPIKYLAEWRGTREKIVKAIADIEGSEENLTGTQKDLIETFPVLAQNAGMATKGLTDLRDIGIIPGTQAFTDWVIQQKIHMQQANAINAIWPETIRNWGQANHILTLSTGQQLKFNEASQQWIDITEHYPALGKEVNQVILDTSGSAAQAEQNLIKMMGPLKDPTAGKLFIENARKNILQFPDIIKEANEKAKLQFLAFKETFAQADLAKSVFGITSEPEKILKKIFQGFPSAFTKEIKVNLKFAQAQSDLKEAFRGLIQAVLSPAEGGVFEWNPNIKIGDKRAKNIGEEMINQIEKAFPKGAEGKWANLEDSIQLAINTGGEKGKAMLLEIFNSKDFQELIKQNPIPMYIDPVKQQQVNEAFANVGPVSIPIEPQYDYRNDAPTPHEGMYYDEKAKKWKHIKGRPKYKKTSFGMGPTGDFNLWDPGAMIGAVPEGSTIDDYGRITPPSQPKKNPKYSGNPRDQQYIQRPISFGGGGGSNSAEVEQSGMDKKLTNAGAGAGVQLHIDIMPALKSLDVIAKRIASLSTIPASVSLTAIPAIKALDLIAKRIVSLSGIPAVISLSSVAAIKSLDVVANRIDSLASIVPVMGLSIREALKSLDTVAKRIMSLEKLDPVVHVSFKGSGTISGAAHGKIKIGQHGFSGWIARPTTFLVGEAGPEYVHVLTRAQMGGGGGSVMNISAGNQKGGYDISRLLRMIMNRPIQVVVMTPDRHILGQAVTQPLMENIGLFSG